MPIIRKLSNHSAALRKPLAKSGGLRKPGAPTTSAKAPARGTDAGFAKARVINDENKRRRDNRAPFRVRLDVGETRKVILLDEKPWFMYEHQWQGANGKWGNFEVCIKEKGNCALCQKLGKEGYYVMMLTCIDLSEYTDKNGKTHKNQKKLLPVKSSMIPKFERIFKKNGESFRGMVLELSRDGQKSSSIGDSVEYEKTLSETTLAKFGDRAVPVDYEKVFPYPTEKDLRARYGGSAPIGAADIADENEEDLDEVNWENED